MKKFLLSCLMLGAFFMVLTGMPLQLLHIDSVKSAYAWGHKGNGNGWGYGNIKHGRTDNGNSNGNNGGGDPPAGAPVAVPEPAMLALIGSGIAGIGVYGYLRRKNRK